MSKRQEVLLDFYRDRLEVYGHQLCAAADRAGLGCETYYDAGGNEEGYVGIYGYLYPTRSHSGQSVYLTIGFSVRKKKGGGFMAWGGATALHGDDTVFDDLGASGDVKDLAAAKRVWEQFMRVSSPSEVVGSVQGMMRDKARGAASRSLLKRRLMR